MTGGARPLFNPDPDASRSSMVVSASLLATALLSAGQALLLPFIAGSGEDTDAFLAAYALYLLVTAFGATLRGSVVPLFGAPSGDDELRRDAGELLTRVLVFAALLSSALLVTAPVVGHVLTHGLSGHAQRTAVEALALLAPTAYLQVHAAAHSAALSVAHRFTFSAALYVGSSALALGCSAVFLSLFGVLGSALGILVGAAVLAGGHSAYLWRLGVRLRRPDGWFAGARNREIVSTLTCFAAPAMAQQLVLAICLSAVSREAGAITAYTYAFFAITLMLSISSLSIGLVMLPDLVADRARDRAAGRDYLVRIAPYAFAVLVPMLAAFALFGRPLLEWVFSGSLPADDIRLIHEIGLVFCPMALATVYLQGAVVLMVAYGRTGLSLGLAGANVVLHAVAVALVAGQGPVAVAGAQAVVTSLIAVAVVGAVLGSGSGAIVGRSLRRAAPAFALGLVFVFVRLPLGPHPEAGIALAGLLVASAIYVVLGVRVWPEVGGRFLRFASR